MTMPIKDHPCLCDICLKARDDELARCRQEEREKEKPNPDGPLGWIKTLHERGELTIHPNSGIAYKIEEYFGVKLEKGIFILCNRKITLS
jgi:hypothetical protein